MSVFNRKTPGGQSTFGGANVKTASSGVVKCGLAKTTYEKQPAWAKAEQHKNSGGQWRDGALSKSRAAQELGKAAPSASFKSSGGGGSASKPSWSAKSSASSTTSKFGASSKSSFSSPATSTKAAPGWSTTKSHHDEKPKTLKPWQKSNASINKRVSAPPGSLSSSAKPGWATTSHSTTAKPALGSKVSAFGGSSSSSSSNGGVLKSSSGVTLGATKKVTNRFSAAPSYSSGSSSTGGGGGGFRKPSTVTSTSQSTFGGANVSTASGGVVKCGLAKTTYEKQPDWAFSERAKNSQGQWKDGTYSKKR